MSDNLKKVYIETYGCQMNVADSEVVVSILADHNFEHTNDIEEADLILVNTCSIRENAEQRVFGRLQVFKQQKKKNKNLLVGVIGCMAERLKEDLLENQKHVDIVIGPDAYRELPKLLTEAETGQQAINVLLSKEETYADIAPIRTNSNGVSAFISIMRGCDNMCSYCIVPYVRGRERSRDAQTIVSEARDLFNDGYKEVTLLGQNVDSYKWENVSFSELLEKVALISPELRVRFATSHPKDMNDEVLYVMAKYNNICKTIHLPIQSGSSDVLKTMNRKYTREWYLDRINAIKTIIPDCAISTDIMVGFSSETEEDHQETLSIMKEVKFDYAFMFKYSERPGTYASKKLDDNIPDEIKTRRLTEVIDLQNKISGEEKEKDLGKTFEVLVEGVSKKSDQELFGRTTQNKVVVFPKENYTIGDYVKVKIERCTSATLIGKAIDDPS
jgi:tRNA-2-methylthio-N6-dimethylallyladenosine synthase